MKEWKRKRKRGERGKKMIRRGGKDRLIALSSLISSSQRYLTFHCIMSWCCHPTGLSIRGRLQDQINKKHERETQTRKDCMTDGKKKRRGCSTDNPVRHNGECGNQDKIIN